LHDSHDRVSPDDSPTSPVSDQVAAAWRSWALKQFGGPPAKIDAAASAAVRAVGRRQDQAQVIAAATRAAATWQPATPQASTPVEAPRAPVAPAPAANGMLRGQAVGVLRRKVPLTAPGLRARFNGEMWSFSLFRSGVGPNGRPLSALPVQLMGWRITGAPIADGDLVEIDGPESPGTIHERKTVRNLSQNGTIAVRGLGANPAVWLLYAFTFAFFGAWIFVALFIFRGAAHF
jgi:hypothetical protein